jgi:hypothetical protein
MGNIERNQRSSAKSDEAPRLLETTVAPGKQPDECVAFSEKSRNFLEFPAAVLQLDFVQSSTIRSIFRRIDRWTTNSRVSPSLYGRKLPYEMSEMRIESVEE